jgi:hypothetical protein
MLQDHLRSDEHNGRRRTRFHRRPFDLKSAALLNGLVGLVALVIFLVAAGFGLGLAWGAFRAAASIAERWLTL